MIYDELIEELALTLLTKARYEGCIPIIKESAKLPMNFAERIGCP